MRLGAPSLHYINVNALYWPSHFLSGFRSQLNYAYVCTVEVDLVAQREIVLKKVLNRSPIIMSYVPHL